MATWEHRLSWPGAVGGFVGKSRRSQESSDDPPDKLTVALAELGDTPTLVEAEQVHGGEVAVVTREMLRGGDATVEVAEVDGLMTDLPGVALAIYVADCLAIFLQDPSTGAIGLAHAGWRGLAADMPGTLVRAALETFGGEAEEMRLALSPCIRQCCFEVGEEVAVAFDGIPQAVDRSRERPHVDMIAVARWQLERAGVPRSNIEVMAGCTRCEPERFASYRRHRECCGRNVALIAREH